MISRFMYINIKYINEKNGKLMLKEITKTKTSKINFKGTKIR